MNFPFKFSSKNFEGYDTIFSLFSDFCSFSFINSPDNEILCSKQKSSQRGELIRVPDSPI